MIEILTKENEMFLTRDKEIAELKERLDALESNVSIYPTKDCYFVPLLSQQVPINQVVLAIVSHLELDILKVMPTYRKVELKPKVVPPTIANIAPNGKTKGE
jgi:hypothetical protein